MSSQDFIEHLRHCRQQTGAQMVILLDGPGRLPQFAALLQEAHPLAGSEAYPTWLGTLQGKKMLACGGPAVAAQPEARAAA